jgi:hypothetical protein
MIQLLHRPTQDQRIIQHNRTWQQFQLIQQGFASHLEAAQKWFAQI